MSDEEHPPAPVEPKMVHTDPWRENAGLIDRLLDMRALPPAGVREMYRYMDSEEYEDGYKAGIDAALDALVPALKELVLQPTLNGMPGAYSKSTTDRIIGRVPLKRTSTGWE